MRTLSRRDLLWHFGGGLGGIALSQMLHGTPHHAPKAKRVIQLFMNGGASQMDTFDPKPLLTKHHGRKFDPSGAHVEAVTSTPGQVLSCPFPFRQHGQSGRWVSSVFPHLARHVDEMAFVCRRARRTSPTPQRRTASTCCAT